MELFFGVPAHPFFVHAPIVLVPLVAIATVALAARPAWRERALLPLTVVKALVTAGLLMAVRSGNALADVADGRAINGDITDHRSLGNQTLLLAIVWLIALVAAVLVGRTRRTVQALSADAAAPSPWTRPGQLLTIVAAVVSIVTTIWLIRTGHAGAESHWIGVTNLIENS